MRLLFEQYEYRHLDVIAQLTREPQKITSDESISE
jgi:hypothetical protein